MQRSSSRSALPLMALTVLIDFIGFGLILPQLPFWTLNMGGNAVDVGLLITLYAFTQFIFTPILGKLSDRYGRKPIIIAALLIEAVSLVLTAIATTLPMLFLARAIGGLGASNVGSAQAVVADITEEKDRAKGMGIIGASIGLGFIIGPALGGLLAQTGVGAALPFWITAGIAVLNAILVTLFLPETRHLHTKNRHQQYGATSLISGWKSVSKQNAIIALIFLNLLFTIAFTTLETTLPLFTQQYFQWGSIENGYIFAYVGIIGVLIQGGLVRQFVKIWNEQIILFAGLILFSIGMIAMAFSLQLAFLLISLGILSVGQGATTPIVSTMTSLFSTRENQGTTLGLLQGMGGLGRVIGPLAAGYLYEKYNPSLPLISGGILVLLAICVLFPVLRHAEAERKMEAVAAKANASSLHRQ